jgi:hypothetical protein
MKQITVNIQEQNVRFRVTAKGAGILSIFTEHAQAKEGDEFTMPLNKIFYYFGVAFHASQHELFINHEVTLLMEEHLKNFTFFFKDGRKLVGEGENANDAWAKLGYTNDDLSALDFQMDGEEAYGNRYTFDPESGIWNKKLTVRQRMLKNMSEAGSEQQ